MSRGSDVQPLIAVYKTFDGDEFVRASLQSVYEHVDAIVMVHSAISWAGETGNTVRPVAIAWDERYDYADKVWHLDTMEQTQEGQYAIGLAFIREKWPTAIVMVVDCDEVWDDQDLSLAIRRVRNHPEARVCAVSMHTYLKHPLYRVDPPYGKPATFFRDPEWLAKCPRGHRAPSTLIADVWMHHFTYVRRSWDAVRRKLESSRIADCNNEQLVPSWKERIWDKLPHAENLHGFIKHQRKWRAIKTVTWRDLPRAVRLDEELVRMSIPVGQLMPGEDDLLHDLASGLGVCIDLGTQSGHSAAVMAKVAKRVITIDLFEDILHVTGEQEYHEQYREYEHKYAKVRRWFAAAYPHVDVIKADTACAAEQFDDAFADLVFVDAGHRYKGVRRDFEAWWPKLKAGGRMVFHDDNDWHPGVQRLCRELTVKLHDVTPATDSGSFRIFRK